MGDFVVSLPLTEVASVMVLREQTQMEEESYDQENNISYGHLEWMPLLRNTYRTF